MLQRIKDTLEVYKRPQALRMLFLGFSAGLPILLIFSSLSLWLREAGVQRSAVTFFSWAALGYSFKFVWAPLVDKIPLPVLTAKLGKRRDWLLLSQIFIILAILGMAFTDPVLGDQSLTRMALFAVLLGFSSATQDISVDAYRIESDTVENQAALSATYIGGYRIGMIIAGAGALKLASFLGSTKEVYSYSAWMWTYAFMALMMLVGVATTLIVPKPEHTVESKYNYKNSEYFRFFIFFLISISVFVSAFFFSSDMAKELKESMNSFVIESGRLIAAIVGSVIAATVLLKLGIVNRQMVNETYVAPVKEFFSRYQVSLAILLLALVGLYRISDIVLGVISNVFYQDLGFNKDQIANIVQIFGVIMTLVGVFIGGVVTKKFGVMKILFVGALLSAGTNLLFMLLASMGKSLPMLYLVISADNLAAGLASAAFIAFLSGLTNISFTAVQYAIFSSLMTLFPKFLGGYSGTMVDSIGYSNFFLVTTLLGVPVLFLVMLAGKKLKLKEESEEANAG